RGARCSLGLLVKPHDSGSLGAGPSNTSPRSCGERSPPTAAGEGFFTPPLRLFLLSPAHTRDTPPVSVLRPCALATRKAISRPLLRHVCARALTSLPRPSAARILRTIHTPQRSLTPHGDREEGPRGDRRPRVRGRVHPHLPGAPERRDGRRL